MLPAGAGIDINGASPIIRNCIVKDCVASVADGGGIGAYYGSPRIEDCIIAHNTAVSKGGGVMLWDSDATVRRCTIIGNESYINGGAGLTVQGNSDPTIEECTLAYNTLGEDCPVEDPGSGMLAWSASVEASNCIIAHGNYAACGVRYGGEIVLSCCDVYGNELGDWVGCLQGQEEGIGNISLDPLFCGAAGLVSPYDLYVGSPCAEGENPEDPECGQIGAWSVGCTTSDAAVEEPAGYGPESIGLIVSSPMSGRSQICFSIP